MGKEYAVFPVESQHRMVTRERKTWLHHRLVMCFYPDSTFTRGLVVGYASFKMDNNDVESFIALVMYCGVGLPMLCLITLLIHRHKCAMTRKRQRTVQFWLDRRRLEEELHEVARLGERVDELE